MVDNTTTENSTATQNNAHSRTNTTNDYTTIEANAITLTDMAATKTNHIGTGTKILYG